MKNVDVNGIARLIIMFLAIANQSLTLAGKNVIELEEDTIYIAISSIFTIISAFTAWYYNNPTSSANIDATALMRAKKKRDKH